MTLKIVDVSSYQGNYKLGVNGEDGILIKATQGTWYVNPNCDYVAQQAIKQNVPWGLYHYAEGSDPAQEVAWFLKNISNYLNAPNKPVLILDWESGENKAWGNGQWVKLWMDELKSKTGIQGGLYTGNDGISQTSQYVSQSAWLWYANYPSSYDVGWSPSQLSFKVGDWKLVTGWQFGNVPVDKSLFYIDLNGWKKLSNSNANLQAAAHPNVTPKSYTDNSYVDALGVRWIRERGTYRCNVSTNLRWGATTSSSLIATLPAGSEIDYDYYAYSGGYVWIRQPRGAGQYGYMATGEEVNGKRTSYWGSFR